jgi:predicted N-formylglutamate amidohydrolase
MMAAAAASGLLDGEEESVIVVNSAGQSPIVLACEHAGRRIPKRLGSLGLSAKELDRHIAYDIGAEGVARLLADMLDAPLVLQRYSRLDYDCNRPPDSPSAMPIISESTAIPGNQNLTASARAERIGVIYRPFHERAAAMIDERMARHSTVIFVTIHSFTPVFKGIERRMHVGLLFDRDRRFTDLVAPLIRKSGPFDVRLNEPYGPEDGVCHTVNLQAGAKGLPYSMIEIRNDLIESEPGQVEWAGRLAGVLQQAGALLRHSSTETPALHAPA